MKKNFVLKFVLPAVFIICSSFLIMDNNWEISSDYSIKFSGIKSEGNFSNLTGLVIFDSNALKKSKIDVEVPVSSIRTGNSIKDDHAKGESWLEMDKFPKIKFYADNFTKENSSFRADATLELHGVSKKISVPFDFKITNNKAVLISEFKIDIKDFDIKGGMMGSMMNGEVRINLNIPLTKK